MGAFVSDQPLNHYRFLFIFLVGVLAWFFLTGGMGLPEFSLEVHRRCEVVQADEQELSSSETEEKELMKPPSYRELVMALDIDERARAKAFQRVNELETGGINALTAQKWLDGLLRLPFGRYAKPPVTLKSPRAKVRFYLERVRDRLDSAVYKQEKAKGAVLQVLGQWIANGGSKGEVLGLMGPPGVGKTALAKEGIAKALSRPFVFISLSGVRDGGQLKGSDMVFIGSEWGHVAEGLMSAEVMNPVIYFDELDKVSESPYGKEIVNTLIALTDQSQNHEFQDAYFRGIQLDISKAMIIFSFNDINRVDPVLLDRMLLIETESLSPQDKVVVAREYMLPKILEDNAFQPGQLYITDEDLSYIIETYTLEAGVRRLREKLVHIVREMNLRRLQEEKLSYPIKVERATIDAILDEHKRPLQTIPSESQVGVVNGLFATSSGTGGVLRIQVSRSQAAQMLDLKLTGMIGSSMQESFTVAQTVAWNNIGRQRQEQLALEPSFGLHIHALNVTAATPKDGPSAGLAVAVAIYSVLVDKAIRHDVAVTGELDLQGKAVAVGGIDLKLRGAKRAGARLVLVPEGNRQDVEKAVANDPQLLDTMDVQYISNIQEAIDFLLK